MRYLYMVRHGRIAYEGNIKRCIGRTDVALDEIGRSQSRDLRIYFKDKNIKHIYSSPLQRCVDTALLLSNGQNVMIDEQLIEIDMGEWENLPLKDIHKDKYMEPRNGEGRINAFNRFSKAIDKIIQSTTGNIVLVTHAGLNCYYLASLLNISIEDSRILPQPFGCINKLAIHDCTIEPLSVGIMPFPYPNKEKCYQIFEHCHTPENVIDHSIKVCEIALDIAEKLNKHGYSLNLDLIYSASLLHDIMRAERKHDEKGYKILIREGYPQVAEIVKYHHNLNDDMVKHINEITVVYLADKYIQGAKFVTVDERFNKSLEKCKDDEAKKAHQRRYDEAKLVERNILNIIGSSDFCHRY